MDLQNQILSKQRYIYSFPRFRVVKEQKSVHLICFKYETIVDGVREGAILIAFLLGPLKHYNLLNVYNPFYNLNAINECDASNHMC